MKKIVIIGAGFSGLTLAYELVKKGFSVHIYDKKSQVGGMVSSPPALNGVYETAANGLILNPKILQILQDIQADYSVAQSGLKKYIFRNFPKRWPLSFFESLRFLFDIIKFIFRKKDNKKPQPNQSVESWVLQNFSPQVARFIVDPVLKGIYAGPIKNLSASLILKRFFESQVVNRANKIVDKKIKNKLVSNEAGFQAIAFQLQEYLEKSGVQFYFNSSWNSQIEYDHLVIATSGFEAVNILNQLELPNAKKNAMLLNKIHYLSVVSVTCAFRSAPSSYQGFGILFPEVENFQVLGLLMNDLIYNRNHEFHSETWIFGGEKNKFLIDSDEISIKELILKERKRIFNEEQEILEMKITKWPKAFPEYNLKLEEILQQIQPINNVTLHGNYLGQIGLSRIIETSEIKAQLIAQSLN